MASTRADCALSRDRTGWRFLNHPQTPLAIASRPLSSGAFTRRASKMVNSSLVAISVMGQLQPFRACALGLDELPEAAAPLPDERLLFELEADVGPLPGDQVAHVVQHHAGTELGDNELVLLVFGRIDHRRPAADRRQGGADRPVLCGRHELHGTGLE